MAISARDRITRLTVYGNESDMIDDINGTDYTDGVVDGTQRFEHIKFNSLPGFGEANAAMYKCEISGTTDLTGKWIRVRYCFYDTDSATTRTVESVFAGKVDSCKYDRYHISRSLVAYDKIYELRNIDISDWWSTYWSTANDSTAFAVFDAMCTYFGVSHGLSSSDFRNNLTILKDAQKGRKLGGCSFADFLRYVGQINGFYWEVLPSGMLTCTAPTASYPQSFDTYTDFKETTIEDADSEAYGTFTVYDGADIIYTSGTGEPTYTFSNNILLYGHTTASLVSILDVTKNYLVWFVGTRPATVEVIYSQIPERQAISVTDNGTARTCVISKNEMWGAQLINQRLTCTGNRVIGVQYSSALNRAANEIQKIGTELTYKVNADNVIEAVNLEAQGGVTINAEALNINGVVTANGAFSIDLDGNPTIDATQATSFYADARLRAIDANNIAYYSSTGVRLSEINEIVPYVEWMAWYQKQSAYLAEYTDDNPLGRTSDEAWVRSNHFETSRSVAVTPQSGETMRREITGARVKSAPDETVVGDNAYGFVNYTAIQKNTAGIETDETVESVFNKDKLIYTPNGSAPTIDIESSGDITAIGSIRANTLSADYAIFGNLNGSVYASNMLGSNSELTPTSLKVDSKDILRTHQSLVGGWGTAIPANANLNTATYCAVGKYSCIASATAASLSNCPTKIAFAMWVEAPIEQVLDNETTTTWQYRVRYIEDVLGNKWMQMCNSNSNRVWTYHEWEVVATDRCRTLASLVGGWGVYKAITSNANLNATDGTWCKIGRYSCSTAVAGTLTNSPYNMEFTMTVRTITGAAIDDESGTWKYRLREIESYNGYKWVQHCWTAGTAGSWQFNPWRAVPYAQMWKDRYSNTNIKNGECVARRNGQTVYINCDGDAKSIAAGTVTDYVTLGSQYRPSETIRCAIQNKGEYNSVQFAIINTNGKVQLYSSVAISSATSFAFHVTYIVD